MCVSNIHLLFVLISWGNYPTYYPQGKGPSNLAGFKSGLVAQVWLIKHFSPYGTEILANVPKHAKERHQHLEMRSLESGV